MIFSFGIFAAVLYVVHGNYTCNDLTHHRNWKLLDRGSDCGQAPGFQIDSRIIGGEVAQPGEFPWMAAIFLRYHGRPQFRCGGSVISDRYILTAGHCMVDLKTNQILRVIDTFVRLGVHNLYLANTCVDGRCVKAVEMEVEKITVHSGFLNGAGNDISLLRLRNKIHFTDLILPICLPTPCNLYGNYFAGEYMTVIGWGSLNEDPTVVLPERLQKATVPVISLDLCQKYWGRMHGKICAGRPGLDHCHGDSGGPIMYYTDDAGPERYFFMGIVSFGETCSYYSPDMRPGVYTRVFSYLPWILDNVHE